MSKNPSKKAWEIINKECNSKKSQNISLCRNRINIENTAEICNIFNNHFVNSVKIIADDLALVGKVRDYSRFTDKTFFLGPVTKSEVISVIKSVADKKSAGMDRIPCYLLKNIADNIAEPLTDIINEAFVTGIFPDKLKLARVIPIFKKNDPTCVKNYRPVSLLSVFSKVIEKCMLLRLTDYFEKNNLFKNSQHGFVKGRSTISAMYDSLCAIYRALDDKKITIGLYFDLKQAFDLLNHDILYKKLEGYGIVDNALSFIKSFLTNRSQIVEITNRKGNIKNFNFQSDEKYLELGAPQGSILAPFLFIVYINDIDTDFLISQFTDAIVKIVKYADDTSMIVSDDDKETAVRTANDTMAKMSSWCCDNKLMLSDSKTGFILFKNIHSEIQSVQLSLNNTNVNQFSSDKFLGLTISETLCWSSHINNVCNKLNSAAYAILCLRNAVNFDTLRTFYFAYAQSYISYGLLCWGSSSQCSRILILQKKVLRRMYNVGFLEHCRPLFINGKIMTIYSLYIFTCLNFVFNNLNLFLKNGDINSREISRNSKNLYIPKHKTTLFEKSPHYMCIKCYNKLPTIVKDIKCAFSFKNILKKFFLNNPYYAVSEFLEASLDESQFNLRND